MLTTLRRRAELVAELGVDAFLVLPFTVALSQVTAEEFVHDVIVDRLHAANVVVGENFRFGHRGAGSVELLRELGPRFGFTVNGIDAGHRARRGHGAPPPTCGPALAPVTCVAATEALGRPHRVEGFVVHGEGRGGSQLGYPTANLDAVPHAAIPADGIYAGWFVLGTRRFAGRHLHRHQPDLLRSGADRRGVRHRRGRQLLRPPSRLRLRRTAAGHREVRLRA